MTECWAQSRSLQGSARCVCLAALTGTGTGIAHHACRSLATCACPAVAERSVKLAERPQAARGCTATLGVPAAWRCASGRASAAPRRAQVARQRRELGATWPVDLTPGGVRMLEVELGVGYTWSLDRLKRRCARGAEGPPPRPAGGAAAARSACAGRVREHMTKGRDAGYQDGRGSSARSGC